jgi:hypothetical protein
MKPNAVKNAFYPLAALIAAVNFGTTSKASPTTP